MKDVPLFSIITCTRNSQDFIGYNFESVAAQKCKDYEHIIIDGKSEDMTMEMAMSYKNFEGPRIKILTSEPKGISAAMNLGIRVSRGTYVIFLHSDDSFYDENVLAEVGDFLKQSNHPDWIYGKVCTIEEDRTELGFFPRHKFFQFSSWPLLRLINYIPHQSVFIRRDVFGKYGDFDTKLKSSMDYDLWLRISNKTKWLFLNRVVARYMIRKGAQSSSANKRSENQEMLERVRRLRLTTSEIIISRTIQFIVDFFCSNLR